MSAWTEERPTKAGWWWYRMLPEKRHEEMCLVKKGTDGLIALFSDGAIEKVDLIMGEWQPVQGPVE